MEFLIEFGALSECSLHDVQVALQIPHQLLSGNGNTEAGVRSSRDRCFSSIWNKGYCFQCTESILEFEHYLQNGKYVCLIAATQCVDTCFGNLQ